MHTAEGMGTNKKVAKRNAAENMLELLGFKVPQPQPPKPALKTEEKVTSSWEMALTLPQMCVKSVTCMLKDSSSVFIEITSKNIEEYECETSRLVKAAMGKMASRQLQLPD